MDIRTASKDQSPLIARLIMQAMNYDCCRHFIGPDHTLDEFERVMTDLVASDNSQYSYLNTLVALNADNRLCGICVSYDGGELHRLRRAFIDAMKSRFDRDFSNIDDETSAGELYLDSLAVVEDCRGQGIATALLGAAKDKAAAMGLPALGLLVDKGNPDAERLYLRSGFEYVGDNAWGGHGMKHLQYKITKNGQPSD